jgi:hypothetical protein
VKYESLERITSCLVGQDKQEGHKIGASWWRAQSNPRTRPGWIYSQGSARDSHSSMYKIYIEIVVAWFVWKKWRKDSECRISPAWLTCLQDAVHILSIWLICLFLCRLKINHDSYEFILEFGTIANTYIYIYTVYINIWKTEVCFPRSAWLNRLAHLCPVCIGGQLTS